MSSGQSGCQIAEELHEAGRDVFLACGRAPWAPRRVGDHNLIWWAVESGFYDAPFSSLPPTAAARGIAPPSIAEPHPFDADAPVQLDLSDFGAVIFASGFVPTTSRGCGSPARLTSSDSRFSATEPARSSVACISSECISC
ncbi:MAG: putative flavoprotein involved in transport, partial [bacterium]